MLLHEYHEQSIVRTENVAMTDHWVCGVYVMVFPDANEMNDF